MLTAKLHLEVTDEKLIKFGVPIQVDGTYKYNKQDTEEIFDPESLPILNDMRKEFPFRITNSIVKSPITVKVHLSFKNKRLTRNPSSNSQRSMKDHWTMTKSFLKMQQEDEFKDFEFQVGNQLFKIHKCVFAASSDMLKRMFLSGFDESKKNFSNITEIDPEVFQVIVDFVYGNKAEFYRNFENSVFAIYRAAHMYEIKVLQDFCVDFFFEHCTGPDRAIETFTFASFYDLKELKELCWETIRM